MPVKRKPRRTDPHRALRDHLLELLRGGHAHVTPRDAIGEWPAISQWDIIEFTKSAEHVSPKWPAGYWPEQDAPPDADAWDTSVAQVERDLRAMERLVADPKTDLFARIPHGTGQTVLREALVLADHNAYHLGQLVLLRRLLGAWKKD